jgi:hypothetical protein
MEYVMIDRVLVFRERRSMREDHLNGKVIKDKRWDRDTKQLLGDLTVGRDDLHISFETGGEERGVRFSINVGALAKIVTACVKNNPELVPRLLVKAVAKGIEEAA